MGFLRNMKGRGVNSKSVKTYAGKEFKATDDEAGTLDVKLRVNTVVIDTSPAGFLAETTYGGTLKIGENVTRSYKSDAEGAGVFRADLGDVLVCSDLDGAEDVADLLEEERLEAERLEAEREAARLEAEAEVEKLKEENAGKKRKRGAKPDTVEPSANGHAG